MIVPRVKNLKTTFPDRIMALSLADGTTLTITKPDDFHHHFRDGDRSKSVLSHTTERFGRCIAMVSEVVVLINWTASIVMYMLICFIYTAIHALVFRILLIDSNLWD